MKAVRAHARAIDLPGWARIDARIFLVEADGGATLRRADENWYAAKESGRKRAVA